MSNTYVSLLQVGVDLGLWFVLYKKAVPTLNLFSAIAKNRWPWMVTNWSTLSPLFKSAAGGDANLVAAYQDFDNAVISAKLGNPQNAFDNSSNIARFYPFLQTINISTLSLTPQETIFRDTELQRISNFTETDFKAMVAFLKYSSAYTASYLGKGDPQGSPLFAQVTVSKQRNATFADFLQLENFIKLQNLISGIVFDYRQRQAKSPDLLTASKANILPGSDVSIANNYLSSVPVPFQGSLEQMAKVYLGSSTKWYELVTINKLQPPYVDQNGTKLLLLSPGNPNNITISGDLRTDIPVGTKIALGSIRVREETRIIEKRLENNDGTLTLFLSGDQDLTKLKTQEKAYVRVRSPGTVYDGSFIMIPLTAAADLKSKNTPMAQVLQELDKALLSFGVDIKRDERTGDIVMDAAGNFQLVYGLDAVRQAFYWAIRTNQGELDWHPDFGIPQAIGNTFLGSTQEAAVFAQTIQRSVMRDARFSSVEIQQLATTGTSISISFIVTVGGSSAAIPLSFIV